MRLKLNLVTGIALMLMIAGLFIAVRGDDGFLSKRVFFIIVGILAWLLGNQVTALEERVAELERAAKPAAEQP